MHYVRGVTTTAISSVRREVNAALTAQGERHLTTKEWSDLLEEGDYWLRAHHAGELASMVSGWRSRAVRVDDSGWPITSQRPAPRWVLAKSLLFADDAETDAQVIKYRELYLPDGLIALADVEAWIDDAVATAPDDLVKMTLWVSPSEFENRPDHSTPLAVTGYFAGISRDSLDFAVAGGGWVHRKPVGRSGRAAELRWLSQHLASSYPGWQPAQATCFVLTGAVPIVNSLRVQNAVVSGRPHPITLTVDPDLSAEEVIVAYLAARREALGVKPRTISERAADLVILAAEHPGSSDHALRHIWNREHPDHVFDEIRAFRQALRDARRRLVVGPRRPRR